MTERNIKRALMSVYDKTGIVAFARALSEEFGVEIISTGGTASLLKKEGIPVTLVEQVTGFPEMMDGRVKTLHPKIHAAILADRDNADHMRQLAEQGIEPIDMVVVNLYPFAKTVADPGCTFEQAIEMIDIGGPCMLRAAAKNHRHVLAVCDVESQALVLEELRTAGLDSVMREELASYVFEATSEYDASIEEYLAASVAESLAERNSTLHDPDEGEEQTADESVWFDVDRADPILFATEQAQLRYGENPHQSGLLLIEDASITDRHTTEPSLPYGQLVGGKAMSFNNYADANAALMLCGELARSRMGSDTAAVFVKHTNACGVGVGTDPIEVYRRAYLGDPNAAMGGILAQDVPVTGELAAAVMASLDRWGKQAGAGAFFVEVWLAPSFTDEALGVIGSAKKWGGNVRTIAVGDLSGPVDKAEPDIKPIAGGLLAQSRDLLGLNEDQWETVTKRKPTDAEMNDLRLAWLICKHTKSNAISVCKDNMLIGNGAGQMSRVMSCRIATWLAKENGHEKMLAGAVAASDAFFPFRDGPDILMDAGISAIIQPGGSKRDADTIAACDKRGVAMILTGTRHFRH